MYNVIFLVNLFSFRLQKVPSDMHYLSNQQKLKAIAVGSVESAYLQQVSPGIDSFRHADYPAILVFIEYLCASEVGYALLFLFMRIT